MKTKKIPMRSCVVTKEKCAKQDLIRIVKTPDGKIVVDITGKLNGRGAYLKKDANVFNKAQKSKTLDRIFETNVPDEVYEKLYEIIR